MNWDEALRMIVVYGIAMCGPIWILYGSFKAIMKNRFFVERRTKKLIERNEDIVDDHLSRINIDSALPENRYIAAQDCMREIIAKRGGKSKWILATTEYHGAMPAEWHGLKDHIANLIYRKSETVRKEQETVREAQERQGTLEHRKKLFDDNWD